MLCQRPQIFIPTVHHALTPNPTPSLYFLLTFCVRASERLKLSKKVNFNCENLHVVT